MRLNQDCTPANMLGWKALPHSKIFSPLELYFIILLLQYPSATKKSPLDMTDTAAGLQKCELSLPGSNSFPRTMLGLKEPGGNYKNHCSILAT